MSSYSDLRFLSEEDEFDTHEHEEHHDDDKPWGTVIGAALCVQMITLVGVLASGMVAAYNKTRMSRGKASAFAFIHEFLVPSFASGALLATAVFLLVPEALVLINGYGHTDSHEEHDEHGNETDAHAEEEEGEHDHDRWLRRLEEEEHDDHGDSNTWKFGAALLGGFLLPVVIHALFPTPKANGSEEKEEEVKEGTKHTSFAVDAAEAPADETSKELNKTEPSDDGEDESTSADKDWGLATSLLVGDFFHNFTDGVFLGTAFLLCGNSVGWTIVATTIYHELAQEIADYALLTHRCGLSMFQALSLNFLSGFSVVIGALIVLATDVSDNAKGVILAISAGVYFYIGGVCCIPRIQEMSKSAKETLLFILFFACGAIPIGLVLLNHEHCEDEHGGHDDHAEEAAEGIMEEADGHDHFRLF